VIPIFLPALRERKGDVSLLCREFIATLNQSSKRRVERVAPEALRVLEHYDWPGNVRELYNVLSYAYTIGDGPLLQVSDLPAELVAAGRTAEAPGASTEAGSLDEESRRILEVLRRAGGNKNRAAKILGMSRVTLWRRLREIQQLTAAGSAGSAATS
jgi:transcriptional regulator with PAS, ATPase and Fis domain